MSRVDVLLTKIQKSIDELPAHYERDLNAKQLSDELLYEVRTVIQDCQSAVDWTATDIQEALKLPGRAPYFPLVKEPAAFQAALDSQLKGLKALRPDIAAAIERHQPYQSGQEVLGTLHALARVNKHRDFTPQVRDETRWVEVEAGDASIGFQPYQEGKGGVSFGGRVVMNGVEVDATTLRPITPGPNPYTETVYVQWLFTEVQQPVLPLLRDLANLVERVVNEVQGLIS